MILLTVLNGRITVSSTFREAHCLIIFETRVLTNTFGPKRDKLTGDWRKLHTEEVRDLYFRANTVQWSIKTNEIDCACGMQGERRVVYRVLVSTYEGKNYLEDLDINGPHWATYSIGTRSSYPSSKADGARSQPLTIYWQVKTGWHYTSTILYASMACTEINFKPTEGMCETYISLSLFHILHQK